jgi:DNA replication and repair protein RecF
MLLQTLKITNFRNYTQQQIQFSSGLNCIVGDNGMGKTAILDAIYYLCIGRSYFAAQEKILVRHSETFFRLEGLFFIDSDRAMLQKIVAKVQPFKHKSLEKNDIPYQRLSEHIGLLPIVMIAPDDISLVAEGSEERRAFMDNTLSQFDKTYLQHLVEYNRILKQRNAALKQFAESMVFNTALIEIYNTQLIEPARIIHKKRIFFMESFLPIFQEYYAIIAGGVEQAGCVYESHLFEKDFATLLHQALEKDRILQRTTEGIHKDDLILTLNGHHVKKIGSQGQLKSFLLALRLAQYDFIKKQKNVTPILLLDDIFDKLDESRVKQLIALLVQKNFGQLFITDTHPERIVHIAQSYADEVGIFTIQDGAVVIN